MADTYLVNGSAFTSIDLACAEINSTGDYADGIQDVIVSITTADTTEVDVLPASAGTADISNYIRIEATSGARHDGTYNGSKQRLETAGSTHSLIVAEDFVHLKFLAIKQTGTGSSTECIRINDGSNDLLVEKCVLVPNDNNNSQDGIYANGDIDNVRIFDTVITFQGTGGRACIHAQPTGSQVQVFDIEHCIIDVNGSGAQQGGGIVGDENNTSNLTLNIDNTIAFDADSGNGALDYAPESGTPTWSGQGNASGDTSCQTQLGTTNNLDSQTVSVTDEAGTEILVTNLTTGSEDYQLIDGASSSDTMIGNAIDGGDRDSRADITIDIAGNPRPGTFTDRDSGAFEVIVAAAGGPEFDINRRRFQGTRPRYENLLYH